MTEPKIDEMQALIARFRTAFGGFEYADQLVAATERLLAENAGLREALEASEAECAKVIEERDAMRPVVEAAVAWRQALGISREVMAFGAIIGKQSKAILAAVDSYTQSSNPGETS